MAWIYAENGCRSASTTAFSQCTHSFCFKCRCVRSHTIHTEFHIIVLAPMPRWIMGLLYITHIRTFCLALLGICFVLCNIWFRQFANDLFRKMCGPNHLFSTNLACMHWMLFTAFFKTGWYESCHDPITVMATEMHKKAGIFFPAKSSRDGARAQRRGTKI